MENKAVRGILQKEYGVKWKDCLQKFGWNEETGKYSEFYYSDYELELYSIYMNEIRDIIKETKLPKYIKTQMLLGDMLHKKTDTEWCLRKGNHEVNFISFPLWLRQRYREDKLNKLGIC